LGRSKKFFKAKFLERIKRFTVLFEKKGKVFKGYLPNPGRLWELLLLGRNLYLKENKVWAVERDGEIISLNTQYTNKVAEKLINENIVEELKGYKIEKKEYKIKRHRIDFLLNKNGKKFPLEVKSCTLFSSSLAMFPDAITERGRKHLEVLKEYRGGVLFIVNSSKPKYFLPDFHTDPEFSETLYNLRKSIFIKAVSVKWESDLKFKFVRELEIPWKIYEVEARDKGSYLIIGFLKKCLNLKISKKYYSFESGWYIYVGSAMNSLKKRIERHLMVKKKLKWHIDYLIPHLEMKKSIPIQSSEKIECEISRDLEKISYGFINGFGSSDCKCHSHLYFMENNPLKDEKFIGLVLKYRIERLISLINIY